MGVFVDDFVSGEEPKQVRIILEGLYDGEDTRQEILIVSRGGFFAVEMLARDGSADVQEDVDSGGVVDRHTFIVVQRGVNVVDSNGVDLKREAISRFTQGYMEKRRFMLTPSRWRRMASRKQTSASERGSSLLSVL